ncbi:hypothetical protein Q4557_07490 [Shewanella sp. 5_MG-2023]|uniref:DUF6702 family protein n=1 Tax=unclassified Shewanella TaxID=196818 RepID=UPI000C82DC50|nr:MULTISPECIES: DUF6702 family protein [unclassified Shewanella]MDO6639800.1 hypothetical protein [Shewanella sp. 5_MG-2023]PMH98193.1 hypothetical protein BCU55_16500 [Shewanella sp. 10N.286.48.A6]
MFWIIIALIWFITLAGLLLFNFQASANRKKESYTNVLFNAKSGNVAIQHCFYLADAQQTAKRILGADSDLVKNPQSRKAFADYVQTNFHIADNNQQLLQLEYLNCEIKGDYLWLYQQTTLAKSVIGNDPKSVGFYIKIANQLTLCPSQLSNINVEHNKQVKVMHISTDNKWQHLALDTDVA